VIAAREEGEYAEKAGAKRAKCLFKWEGWKQRINRPLGQAGKSEKHKM
jgi:hypothetical protein